MTTRTPPSRSASTHAGPARSTSGRSRECDAACEEVATTCDVMITGRLGKSVVERELPSGDRVLTFTVIVDRPWPRPGQVTVDALPCQVFGARLRARVARLEPGTVVDVRGTLRRRFWRAPAGLGSALEVDVQQLSVVA